MIRVSLINRGGIGHQKNVVTRWSAAALADLVHRLTGDAGITGIGPKSLTLDCPVMGERVEYVGDEDKMDLLIRVGHLYLQARPWLSSEAIRKLVGEE